MHDFLNILGVAAGAGPDALRRASDRRVRRWHPDFDAGVMPRRPAELAREDVAIDFVDMSAVIDRIHAAFFQRPS